MHVNNEKNRSAWASRLDAFEIHDATGDCILTDEEKALPAFKPSPRIDAYEEIDASGDDILSDDEKAWPVLVAPSRAKARSAIGGDPAAEQTADAKSLVVELVANLNSLCRQLEGTLAEFEKEKEIPQPLALVAMAKSALEVMRRFESEIGEYERRGSVRAPAN
jgi:hypothetical protein